MISSAGSRPPSVPAGKSSASASSQSRCTSSVSYFSENRTPGAPNRRKEPDAEIEDLEKAKWYLEREIERLRGGADVKETRKKGNQDGKD